MIDRKICGDVEPLLEFRERQELAASVIKLSILTNGLHSGKDRDL